MSFGKQTDNRLTNELGLTGDPQLNGMFDCLGRFCISVDRLRVRGDDTSPWLASLFGKAIEVALDDSSE